MSVQDTAQADNNTAKWSVERGVRHIKPSQFDSNTPQTSGMSRVAAVSNKLAGSDRLWAGIAVVEPHVASGKHHHGEQETTIYVLSGRARVLWGEHLEFEVNVEPGDFIYVPQYVPHAELNPGDVPSEWVVIRTGQEPIVINLELTEEEKKTTEEAMYRQ
jgi:uncharacterized RmlC-like cupin family protein